MRPLVALLLLASAAASPQAADYANKTYRTPEGRANMSGVLAGPDRDERQKPKDLMAALAIRPGSVVADVGTGVGYMLPYLSRAVGPKGKVIAQDIFPDFLEKAQAAAAKEGLANVSFVLGTEKDARLPDKSADVILVLDTYHHFDYPGDVLAGLRKALRKNGRLVVVDFYKNGFRDPQHVRLDRDDAIREIESYGFRLVRVREHIPKTQYIAEFARLLP